MIDEEERKKKRKERQSIIEHELFMIIQVSLNKCLNQALDDILKCLRW